MHTPRLDDDGLKCLIELLARERVRHQKPEEFKVYDDHVTELIELRHQEQKNDYWKYYQDRIKGYERK